MTFGTYCFDLLKYRFLSHFGSFLLSMFGICLASEIGRREPQLPEVNEAEDEVEKALITHEMIANAEALAPGADWPGMRSLPK